MPCFAYGTSGASSIKHIILAKCSFSTELIDDLDTIPEPASNSSTMLKFEGFLLIAVIPFASYSTAVFNREFNMSNISAEDGCPINCSVASSTIESVNKF